MISPSLIKYVRSLEQKKFRNLHGSFIAEGDKIVRELLDSDFQLEHVFALETWIIANSKKINNKKITLTPVSGKELDRLSLLKTPNQALAVVKVPQNSRDNHDLLNNLTLVLDNIQDPGNLGTIMRTADWFGIRNIYCSSQSADVYNPKVIQATMGSFIRVKIHYLDLREFLKSIEENIPVYGAFLNGDNLFSIKTTVPGVLVIGNESKGISDEVGKMVSQRLRIPGAGNYQNQNGPESLNAAIAAGIMMSCIKQP